MELVASSDDARLLIERSGKRASRWAAADLNAPPSRISPTKDWEALVAELDGVADDEIDELWLAIEADDRSVEVYLSNTRDFETRLVVEGRDRTAVEGIFAQMSESMTRRVAGLHRSALPTSDASGESPQEAGAVAEPREVSSSTAPTPGPPQLAWHSNPWTVTIVGGVIVVLVAALLLALLRLPS